MCIFNRLFTCTVAGPSQLIDKRQEAAHIYVDTARNFGLTLNFNKGKTEALVSWTTQVLSHVARQEDQGAHMLRIPDQVQPLRLVSEYKHVCTWVSSAASSQRDISHKVSVATTGSVQAVKTVFSRRQYTRELRIRAMQVLVESRLLSNSGGCHSVSVGQTQVGAQSGSKKNSGEFQKRENVDK